MPGRLASLVTLRGDGGVAMKRPTFIKDMHYKVLRVPAVWSRAAYLCCIYRHDLVGRPYLYHAFTAYGNDWRQVRSAAIAYGKAWQRVDTPKPLRNVYVTADQRPAFKAWASTINLYGEA